MRTISDPARWSAATCATVESTSAVSVLVIDCTTTGASPPTITPPTGTATEARRFSGAPEYPVMPQPFRGFYVPVQVAKPSADVNGAAGGVHDCVIAGDPPWDRQSGSPGWAEHGRAAMQEPPRSAMIRSAMKAPYLEREEEHELAVRWKEQRDQDALHQI